jgi:hypothetical protein
MAEEALALRDVEQPLPQAAEPRARSLKVTPWRPTRHFMRGAQWSRRFSPTPGSSCTTRMPSASAARPADAGELEQLRRGDRAGRHDHFARARASKLLALHGVAHADAALALEQQALRMRAGLDAQIAPRARRIEIDARGDCGSRR